MKEGYKKNIFFYIITYAIMCNSCSQNSSLDPGYRWDLFKNTPSWELTQALEKEDTISVINIVNKSKIDINLQEPKFGRTLLMLSVGNDKLHSTSILLKLGAKVNLRDKRDDQAIHEAVAYIDLRRNSFEILRLLLQNNANPNSISSRGSNIVPLEGAADNLLCAQLLIEHGANIYFRTKDSSYIIWSSLCSNLNDNIYLAKYLIIEKKLLVPNPILYAYPDHSPRNIIDLLKLLPPTEDVEKENIKKGILDYLKKNDYPNHGVFLDTPSPP